MRRKWMLTGILIVALLLTLAGLSLAQGEGPQESAPEGTLAVQGTIGTNFLYQGRLIDNGMPANGTYDFRFRLYDAASGGNQIGSSVYRNNIPVHNGLFNVTLDFGSAAFRGEARWLQVEVRPGTSTGSYTVLTPRQPILAVPYALSLRPGAVIKDSDTAVYIGWNGRLDPNLPFYVTYGVFASAKSTASSTWAYGVYGIADDSKGFGGAFHNTASDGAALYARSGSDSAPDLILGRNSSTADNGVLASEPNDEDSDLVLRTNDTLRIDLDADKSGNDADFEIHDRDGKLIFNVDDSGTIYSSAATEITVSPLAMVAYHLHESRIDFRPIGAGVMVITPNNTGITTVYLPVNVPSTLFGHRVSLRSVRVCYKCNNANSYIDSTAVRQTTDTGNYKTLLYDNGDKKSTSWRCYTVSANSPQPIEGSLIVRFDLRYNGTGVGHELRIGNVTLNLMEKFP